MSNVALPAPTQSRDGWKLVPVEATDEMIQAVHDAGIFLNMTDAGWAQSYRAMLSASPPSPTLPDVREALELVTEILDAVTELHGPSFFVEQARQKIAALSLPPNDGGAVFSSSTGDSK